MSKVLFAANAVMDASHYDIAVSTYKEMLKYDVHKCLPGHLKAKLIAQFIWEEKDVYDTFRVGRGDLHDQKEDEFIKEFQGGRELAQRGNLTCTIYKDFC